MLAALAPNLALAAGGGEHGAAPDIGFYLKWINFILFMGVILYFARKMVPQHLAQRNAIVNEALKRARELEDQTLARMREYDLKLQGLGNEITHMLQQAREQAETERQKLVEDGKREATEILAAARRSAQRLEEGVVQEARIMLANEAFKSVEAKVAAAFLEDNKAASQRQEDFLKRSIEQMNNLEKQ